tara:strand:+ start:616 stop:1122 length:507 start_codon:yes stop_codon:yes gene_type:complete
MNREQILREELTRMRQLMGMNGSLYQKPIMEDESRDEGHGETEPNPRDYKGGVKNTDYQRAYDHWSEHQPAPSPPAPPPPSPPPPSPPPPSPPPKKYGGEKNRAKRDVPKKGTGSKSALDSGQFVLPAGSTPGARGKIGRAKSKSISRKVGTKKGGSKKGKNKKKKED